jgi:hypothetical protein
MTISISKSLIALAAASALVACSAVPIPVDVDLHDRMGDDTSGSVQAPITAGETQDIDLRLPADGGQCVDFSDEGFDVTIESAQLHWIVDAEYDGPELTGKLQARLYVAGADDELFASQHTLGPTFTLNLDRTTKRLAGTANLHPTQLRAIEDRIVCWGMEVTGKDVSAAEDGTATVRFDVKSLRLRVGFSVL